MKPAASKLKRTGTWVWLILAVSVTAYVVWVSDHRFTIRTLSRLFDLCTLVGFACFVGAVFEYKAWSRFAAFLARPLIRFGRLPKVSGVAFLTAIFSNNAANTLVAGSYSEGRMTRTEMIISGLCNSYPAMVSHSLRILVPLFGAIGMAAIGYYAITFGTGLIMTIGFLCISRLREDARSGDLDGDSNAEDGFKGRREMPWRTVITKSLRRTGGVLLRILTVTAPIYFVVAYLGKKGVFRAWESAMPEGVSQWMSPEIMAILAARLGGLINAGGVASEFLKQGQIEPWQIVLAFLVGNVITNPIRTLRRNLPSALGIFPGRDGLWIVLILQVLRFAAAVLAIVLLLRWHPSMS